MTSIEDKLKKIGGWRLSAISQTKELDIEQLKVSGQVPQWLSGDFIATGPALFDIKGKHVKHWFEGLAMLKGFYFHNGKIGFKNKMLKSDVYKRNILNQQVGDAHDNGCVAVHQFNSEGSAMTESPVDCAFNLKTLEALGHTKYTGNIDAHMTLAHLLDDPNSDDFINVGIQFGDKTKYLIYSVNKENKQRKLLATHEADFPFYMHSFSVTDRYFILFQSPLIINTKALTQDSDFSELIVPMDGAPTQFIIIDRVTGKQEIIVSDFFVCIHQANAFEDGDKIILDLCDYDSLQGYNDGTFAVIIDPEHTNSSHALLTRHTIDMTTKSVATQLLSEHHLEFPRISSNLSSGKKHQYVYASFMSSVYNFFDGLIKVDVNNKQSKIFKQEHHYYGEPIFVPNPAGESEDDGVILSMVFDAEKNKSLLLILDATTFTELAHAYLPIPIPFGLHGNWFKN